MITTQICKYAKNQRSVCSKIKPTNKKKKKKEEDQSPPGTLILLSAGW